MMNQDTLTNTDLNDLSELSDILNEQVFESFESGYYIGMMSGTSLDGLDAVIVQFTTQTEQPLKIIATHTKDFPAFLHHVLLCLCQPNGYKKIVHNTNTTPIKQSYATYHELHENSDFVTTQFSELDWVGWASKAYGEFASEVVNELLEKSNLDAEDILAIGCHGQTVRHRPNFGFTLQLVDANIVAEHTGISVVSDFRRRDMAVGGQGAPLAPAFHHAMFSDNKELRVLLNLGGIANITVLPATDINHINDEQQKICGYDTGPANLLLDAWIQKKCQKSYDDNGRFARSGTVLEPLLTQLLTHKFFELAAPKSTGREEFNLDWLQKQLHAFTIGYPDVPFDDADIQATLTELTVVSIANEVKKQTTQKGSLYVCGGGAFNGYLLERLNHYLPNWQVLTTEALGISPTWIEATAFAWLAKQTLMNEQANLPSVTGANKGVVLGQVCFA